MRKIIHVDMDAFFGSVEQRDHPSWRGRPVIVGGNPHRRGVVSAASYEARRYGIHSAMPGCKAFELCPHGIFVKPRMSRYAEESRAIFAIFRSFSPLVEGVSIDEAYLDVTENYLNTPSATLVAMAIRKRIYDERGLTASAGVSYNKFLAKMASERRKPDGLSVITPQAAREFLDQLEIGKFHGIGKVTAAKFRKMGVRCGADLLQLPRELLEAHFGKVGDFYYDIVRGVDNRPVETSSERKSLGRETTFQEDVADIATVKRVIGELSQRVSDLLKERGLAGKTVTLKLRYENFQTLTRAISGNTFICERDEIEPLALTALEKVDLAGRKVRLLGITVSNFFRDEEVAAPLQLEFNFDLPQGSF